MASLATYFGLGHQTHRSLDDVRMNLEVLKYCATGLFLCWQESSLPDNFTENSWVSPNATTRSRANGKSPINQIGSNECTPSSTLKIKHNPSSSPTHHIPDENCQTLLTHMTPERNGIHLPQVESNPAISDPFSGMAMLSSGLESDSNSEASMEEEKTESTPVESSMLVSYEKPLGCDDFLGITDISVSAISVKLIGFYRGVKKIQILYRDSMLQLQCLRLKVRFGISTRFMDHAGRPRLSIVVDAPENLCKILVEIDALAQKLSIESSSTSEWRPVVARKPGFYDTPNVRLHLPTITDGENTRWATEMYQKDNLAAERVVFRRFDVGELECLFTPGDFVDACFALDTYEYQQ